MPRRTEGEEGNEKVCRFVDYAPNIFFSIRSFYNITSEEYVKSFGSETSFFSLFKGELNTLNELTSSGKSGSFFYYTTDGRLVLKTIK